MKEGRERSLVKRHPWVFEGAINKPLSISEGSVSPGDMVRIESASGAFLAWAAYNRNSSIRARVWSFDEGEAEVTETLLRRRISEALSYRKRLQIGSNGVRLIHGEADGFPGLIVDRYDDLLSVQYGSAAVDTHKDLIADALARETGLTHIYERSDAASRKLEGLAECTGWLRGGGATERVISEEGMRLTVDVATGHKTGYYLDQRDNRRRLREWVRSLGLKRVLNCFSYTGGFSISALYGGAESVTSVDTSAPALERVQAHVASNAARYDLTRTKTDVVCMDANSFMRQRLEAGEAYDAIVLDPPKYAPTAAHADKASRLYKDINRIALMLLAPGGLLLTFSCSGGVDASLFQKIVAGAAMDAKCDARILSRLEGAADHPTTMMFPEGDYLKGLALVKR